MKVLFHSLTILFLIAAPAAAQIASPAPAANPGPLMPRVDIFGGANLSFMKPGTDLDTTRLPGLQVSLNVSPFTGDSWLSRLGFAVEIAGARQTRSLDDALVPSAKVRVTEATILAGPTFRTLNRGRLTSQFRALFGVTRLRTTFPSDVDQPGIGPGQLPSSIGVFEDEDALSAFIGSNVDIRISRAIAVRINSGALITRFGGETQISQRVSTGLVFRWYGSDTAR
jgi:hypothetical protein